MSNWNEILEEINKEAGICDNVRRKYLKKLSNYTGRNTIVYYSGWLQKPGAPLLHVCDNDKNGFMSTINKMDRTKGLDLLVHTPGGETAATESIIDYLTTMFDSIRVIVPQLALSAGTMIACSGNEIIMGKHSSLGPIDPQYNGVPAHGIIEEFNQAFEEIKIDQAKVYLWQQIISKYTPTLIGECQKSIKWSEQIVRDCLSKRMLSNDSDKQNKIDTIIRELGDHSISLSHGRHISAKKCKEIGLVVNMLEDDQRLQDAVLSVHHSIIHTLTSTPASKIIENDKGTAYIQTVQQVQPILR